MLERPGDSEAAPFYFPYINQVVGDDPFVFLETQLEDALALFPTISEEASLRRYAPDKWSIRQVLNHVYRYRSRAFAFRLLWFSRAGSRRRCLATIRISPHGGRESRCNAVGCACWRSFRQVRLVDNLALSEYAGGRVDKERHRQRKHRYHARAGLDYPWPCRASSDDSAGAVFVIARTIVAL